MFVYDIGSENASFFKLSLFSFTVLHLLLYSGSGVVLSVPEDKLRAEDGGDACCRGDLQHHHPPDTCLPSGWI